MTLHIHMPTYNEERHIEHTLDSIRSQTFRDWRLTIHDNASTDRTVAICNAVARKDVRVVIDAGRRNVGVVMQALRSHCHYDADYVSFRSANDVLRPDYYAATMDLIQSDPGIALAYSHGWECNQDAHWQQFPAPDEFRIDTRGMSAMSGCAQVMWRYTAPFSLWGVYRRETLELCRHGQYGYGSDHVIVAEMALYGAVAPTVERLDIRRRAAATDTEVARANSLALLEEHARGIPSSSVFYGVRQHFPFTDMAHAHLEMIRLAHIPCESKPLLMRCAVDTFRGRFGDIIRDEADRLATMLKYLGERWATVGDHDRLHTRPMLAHVTTEAHKARTLRIADVELLDEIDTLLFSLSTLLR